MDSQIKKETRLRKNRQSALASRIRKKEYIDFLLSKLEELTNKCERLTQENENLRCEMYSLNQMSSTAVDDFQFESDDWWDSVWF